MIESANQVSKESSPQKVAHVLVGRISTAVMKVLNPWNPADEFEQRRNASQNDG